MWFITLTGIYYEASCYGKVQSYYIIVKHQNDFKLTIQQP